MSIADLRLLWGPPARLHILRRPVPPAEPGATLYDAPSRVARDRVEVSPDVARRRMRTQAVSSRVPRGTSKRAGVTPSDARRRVAQSCPRLGRGDRSLQDMRPRRRSLQQVDFVDRHPELLQELLQLVSKRQALVMLFLLLDVS